MNILNTRSKLNSISHNNDHKSGVTSAVVSFRILRARQYTAEAVSDVPICKSGGITSACCQEKNKGNEHQVLLSKKQKNHGDIEQTSTKTVVVLNKVAKSDGGIRVKSSTSFVHNTSS